MYTKFNDSNVIDRLEQQLKKFSSSDLILIGWILIVELGLSQNISLKMQEIRVSCQEIMSLIHLQCLEIMKIFQ